MPRTDRAFDFGLEHPDPHYLRYKEQRAAQRAETRIFADDLKSDTPVQIIWARQFFALMDREDA